MWYTLGYAHTLICTPASGGRAGHTRDRSPVPVRLHGTPLPDAPGQCRGAADDHDCPPPALHRSDGAPHHSCLPPARPCRAPAASVAAPHPGYHLRRWGLRGPAGAVTPESADVRQADQPGAAGPGRRGAFRRGSDAAAGQRRSQSCGPAPVGRGLEAGQALDDQSRAGVYPKQNRRDRLIPRAMAQPSWALGVGDEVWWRRLAQPAQHHWTDTETTHKWQELTPPPDAPAPKTLACYGLLVRPGPQQADQMWLRFVAGRPVSAVTSDVLAWCSAQLAARGFTARLLIWDNASWHRSHAVRRWLHQHHPQGQQGATGVRLVVCPLPSKSPWLHPIEPKWVHGKRAVAEADRLLSADELEVRVDAYYDCERAAHLVMPKKVA